MFLSNWTSSKKCPAFVVSSGLKSVAVFLLMPARQAPSEA
jgi:hypothetical protein